MGMQVQELREKDIKLFFYNLNNIFKKIGESRVELELLTFMKVSDYRYVGIYRYANRYTKVILTINDRSYGTEVEIRLFGEDLTFSAGQFLELVKGGHDE